MDVDELSGGEEWESKLLRGGGHGRSQEQIIVMHIYIHGKGIYDGCAHGKYPLFGWGRAHACIVLRPTLSDSRGKVKLDFTVKRSLYSLDGPLMPRLSWACPENGNNMHDSENKQWPV